MPQTTPPIHGFDAVVAGGWIGSREAAPLKLWAPQLEIRHGEAEAQSYYSPRDVASVGNASWAGHGYLAAYL
jgi:hypothetical protein